jgi:hypothetical protein
VKFWFHIYESVQWQHHCKRKVAKFLHLFKISFFFSTFMDQFLYSPSYMGKSGVKVKYVSFMSNHNSFFSIILAH